MKRLLQVLLMTIAVVCLTGCPGTIPKVETKYVFKRIPSQLVQPCRKTKPVPKNDYLSLDDKETYLTKHVVQQNGVIDKCDDRFAKIRQWEDQQEQNYTSSNVEKK